MLRLPLRHRPRIALRRRQTVYPMQAARWCARWWALARNGMRCWCVDAAFRALRGADAAAQEALSAERELRAHAERERDTAQQRVSELEAMLVEVRCIACLVPPPSKTAEHVAFPRRTMRSWSARCMSCRASRRLRPLAPPRRLKSCGVSEPWPHRRCSVNRMRSLSDDCRRRLRARATRRRRQRLSRATRSATASTLSSKQMTAAAAATRRPTAVAPRPLCVR